MPKKLIGLSAVEIGGDLYTIGGYAGYSNGGRQTAIHRMSCSARVCTWTTMPQELKEARYGAVAIKIAKSFCVPIEK